MTKQVQFKGPMNFSLLPPISDQAATTIEKSQTRGISLASPPRRRKKKHKNAANFSSIDEMAKAHGVIVPD